MNKTYHTVWNETTGTWVAASEITKSKKKSNATKISLSMALAVVSLACFSTVAGALPGIFVNDGTDTGCTNLQDPWGGSTQPTNNATKCQTPITNRNTQTSTVLFYGDKAADGSKHLTLAGQLYVNSGNLGVGGGTATGAIRIGGGRAASDDTGLANSSGVGTLGVTTSGVRSIAIGAGATNALATVATGMDSLAFGTTAYATGANTISIGTGAGTGATAASYENIAMGQKAGVGVAGMQNIALGVEAGNIVTGNFNFALGDRAGQRVTGEQNQALGNSSGQDVTGSWNLSYGSWAGNKVAGLQNQAFGDSAGKDVIGDRNSSVGSFAGADVEGSNNAAVGAYAGNTVVGDSNSAFGPGAGMTVTGSYNVGVGYYAGSSVTGEKNIAIGIDAGKGIKASNAISVGSTATASADDAIAIGSISQAKGLKSIAVGYDAIATGSVAMGASARAGNGGAAFGDGAVATYLGGATVAGTVAGAALGQNAIADISGATALGTNSSVTVATGVALGSGSVANTAAGIAGYVPPTATAAQSAAIAATVATNAAVDVGSRQITSVAAGTNDDDAVNVSQLKAITSAAATHYYSVNDGGTVGANYNNDGATGLNALAAGVGALANADSSTAVGAGATASQTGSVALGNAATTATNATTEASATLNNLTYGTFAGQVTDSGMQVSVGAVGAERQIKNVGSGAISATSTDGINGSQLYATNSILGNLANTTKNILGGNAALNPNGSLTMTNIGGTGKNNIHDAIAAAKTTVTQGTNMVVTPTNNPDGSTNYEVATSLTPTFTSVSITSGPTLNSSGIDMGGDKITNLAAGTAPTDAVNFSQLAATELTSSVVAGNNTTVSSVTTGNNTEYTVNAKATTASGSTAVKVTPTVGANDVTDYAIDLEQTTKDDIKAGVDAKDAIDNTGLTFNGDSGTTGIKKLGDAVAVTGDTNITTEATAAGVAIKLNPNINLGAAGSVTMGNTVVNNTGLTISGGPSVTSAGIDAANNKITNLTAGDVNSTSTDAVNGSQLYTVQTLAGKGHNVTTAATGTGTVSGTSTTNVAPGDTITYTAGNNIAVMQNGKEIQIATSLTPTFTTVNTTNLTATGVTQLGSNFTVNNAGDVTYTGPITNGNNITNKTYVDQTVAASKIHYYSVNDNGVIGGNYNNDGATGTNALAAGVNASTSVANSVAIGNGATITHKYGGTGTVVIGNNASSTTSNVYTSPTTANVVIGNAAVSTAGLGKTVVIGNGASSQVGQATVMGTNASATSVYGAGPATGSTFESGSVVIGNGAKTYIDGSTLASGLYSPTAVGNGALAMADGAVALGEAAKASIVKSTSLGTNSKVTVANGVALGADSVANTAAGAVGYVPTGANATETAAIAATNSTTLGAVSVGSTGNTRQITNVAAGTANSDAVNVSQLKAVTTLAAAAKTEVVAGTNVKDVTSSTGANGQTIYTVNANGTTASAGSTAVTVTPTAGANNVTDYAIDLEQTTKDDIKAGVDAKDAIDNTGLTFNGDSGTTGIKKLGDAVAVTGDTNITTEATAAGVAIKLNPNINLGAAGSVTMGNTVVNNAGLTISGGPGVTSAGIDAGNKTITNLAAGTAPTDAVNFSQLAATELTSSVVAGNNTTVSSVTTGNNTEYTVNAKATTASGSTAVKVTPTVGANDVTDYAIDLEQTTKDDIKAGVDAKDAIDNTGLTFKGDTGSTGIKKLGDAVAVTGYNVHPCIKQ